jgi:hypothetical protein
MASTHLGRSTTVLACAIRIVSCLWLTSTIWGALALETCVRPSEEEEEEEEEEEVEVVLDENNRSEKGFEWDIDK